jgi:MHS family proline/betaine transporter-like MFS transporter
VPHRHGQTVTRWNHSSGRPSLARPTGALLFAHYGARLGRRQALAASILLMAVATAAIGLLPGYGWIGWLAPALLVLLRAAQGVAVGGEYGGSAAFVIEYAPADRRGSHGGWQWATVALGLAGGIATAALLSATLDGPALRGWGWRLAFLLALPLGLVGLWIRLRIAETPGFRAVQRLGGPWLGVVASCAGSSRRTPPAAPPTASCSTPWCCCTATSQTPP